MRSVHPGTVFKGELATIGITPTALARQLAVPPNRLSQIIVGKRSVTGGTAMRLGHWFGTGLEFWLNLQSRHDLAVAVRETGRDIRKLPNSGSQIIPALE